MSATDSFRLRGKLWLDESDHRTHLTDPSAGYGRADHAGGNAGRVLARVRRGAHQAGGRELVRHERRLVLAPPRAGRHGPRVPDREGEPARVADRLRRRSACFVDPQSFYWMRPTMANARLGPQSGGADAAVRACRGISVCWTTSADPRLPDYKLYVFLNAFYVDAARREAIHAKLKRNGATALFVYAPGYLGPEGASLEGMRALTGIRIAKEEAEGRPQVLLEAGDPLARGLAARHAASVRQATHRLAAVLRRRSRRPDRRPAGRQPRGPGWSSRQMDGWTSIYSAAMQLPAGLMRNIARAAGVHIWLETDDALYTDGQFVGRPCGHRRREALRLPTRATVFDALSGKPLAT